MVNISFIDILVARNFSAVPIITPASCQRDFLTDIFFI